MRSSVLGVWRIFRRAPGQRPPDFVRLAFGANAVTRLVGLWNYGRRRFPRKNYGGTVKQIKRYFREGPWTLGASIRTARGKRIPRFPETVWGVGRVTGQVGLRRKANTNVSSRYRPTADRSVESSGLETRRLDRTRPESRCRTSADGQHAEKIFLEFGLRETSPGRPVLPERTVEETTIARVVPVNRKTIEKKTRSIIITNSVCP